MLAREQELNTQLQQLIGALLLAVPLWVARILRFYATSWFRLAFIVRSIPKLSMLFVASMPFAPICWICRAFINRRSISILDGGAGSGFRQPVLLAGTPENIARRSSRSRPSKKPWSRWSIGSTSQDSRLVTWWNGCVGTPFPG